MVSLQPEFGSNIREEVKPRILVSHVVSEPLQLNVIVEATLLFFLLLHIFACGKFHT